jgi:hypothetical protein
MMTGMAALAGLTVDERAEVLAILLRAHPPLVAEAERAARSLLEPAERGAVSREVRRKLLGLELHDLAVRAGPQRGGGYVEPWEAAHELLTETVQPYLDDVERRARAGAHEAAIEIALGTLLGMYACRTVDDNDLLLTHAGMPDAVDELAECVRSQATACGVEISPDWLAEECPSWR